MAADDKSVNLGKCPICRRTGDARYRPFCSRRCADVDLARWLGGVYAIASEADDDEDGEEANTRAAGVGGREESN